jgi:hypothetical protein
MLRSLRLLPLALALGALAAFAISCGGSHASMRFVHASPDAPNVDVAVDGKTVSTNLPFTSVSPGSGYLTITAGNRLVEVRPTGTATDLVNAPNVGFGSHQRYTVFFTGLVNAKPPNQAISLVTDDNSAPQSGNFKLRVFHASPSACATPPCSGVPPSPPPSPIDVYVVAPGTNIANLPPTIPSLAYQQASGYLDIGAASYEVIVTLSGSKTPKVDQTYSLTAGQIRTLVVVDQQNVPAMSLTPLVLADLN